MSGRARGVGQSLVPVPLRLLGLLLPTAGAGMHVLYSSNAGGYVPDRAGGAHQGGEDANYATPAFDGDGDGLYDGIATHPDEHAEGGPPGRSSLGGNAPTRRRHVCLRARVFVHSQ